MKILLLTDVIPPYRVPVFNALAKTEGVSFRALALCRNMKSREWIFPESEIRFDYRILSGMQVPLSNRPPFILNRGVKKSIERYNPDLIICCGYHQPAYVQALMYCRRRKKKAIIWVESHEESLRRKTFFASAYRKWFLGRCDGYIVPGKKSRTFLLKFGIENERIFTAPNAVDNKFFAENVENIRKEKDSVKKRMGYPEKLILYVGRIIREKGVYDLLGAFKGAGKDTGLIFVGSGEDEKPLKRKTAKESIGNVFFEGFKELGELPFYYAISDLFIFPTHRDEWGLVVNEACASGLPVVSSASAGASSELVSEQNGALFEKGDIKDLSGIMKDILGDEKKRESMAEKSRELARGYAPEICAGGIMEASRRTLS